MKERHRRHKRTTQRLLLTVLLVCGTSAIALATPFEDAGYEVLDVSATEDTTEWLLRGPMGHEIEVDYPEEHVASRHVRILDAIRINIFNLEALEVKSISVAFQPESDRADVLAIPAALEHDGHDLLPYVPAGLRFTFDQALEYDFRLQVDDYFIRFQGQFIDEELFLDRLVSAVQDPVAFLESRRPDLLARRTNELEEETTALREELARTRGLLDETRQELAETREELADTQQAARTQRDELVAQAQRIIEAQDQKLAETQQTIQTQREELDEAQQTIQAQGEEIRANEERLVDQNRQLVNLRSAVLAFNNRTFLLRRERPVAPEAVERIVELRESHPTLDRGEIRDRLAEDGIDVSGNEIDIVLAVFFNEFE